MPHYPSTNEYGKRNKCPQEAVPEAVQDKVSGEMLAAFEALLGLPQGGLPRVAFRRCQLWGAALPLNSPGVDCVLDPLSRVGICGDWMCGSSMQAAAVSGLALADKLVALRWQPVDRLDDFKLGLTAAFKPIPGATDIGQFAPALPKLATAAAVR